MNTVKEQGRPWLTAGAVSLDLPPRGGPYAAWIVTVRSKGRTAETFSITDGGPGFTLDCDGKYRRHKDTMWSPKYHARRPLNAAFGDSVPTILRKVAKSYGRVSGRARVGSVINVVGARDAGGKATCGVLMTVTWPQRPTLGPDGRGSMCGPYGIQIPEKSYFKKYRSDGSYRTITAPTRGKRIVLSTTFAVRGHTYTREFDLGLVK